MNYRLAVLAIAGLALAASRTALTSGPAHPGVDILVNGAAQPRYGHDGRWYVEALKGHEYAIRLHNPYGVRLAVALSVDGLNTIDARQTTATDARKWVLDPYQTVTIRGWQTSRTEARRFEFTTEARSYGQALGRTDNLGVISAVFFKERTAPVTHEYRDRVGGAAQAAREPSSRQEVGAPPAERKGADNEYAATGMGRPTGHAVHQVWLDLEPTPVQSVQIRYEFRPQLVRLGILPTHSAPDPLHRRERARGFDPEFAPVR